jgi:hypothetical protein
MADLLRERLVAFRAAYYRIQILRGLILTALWSIGVFGLFSFSEGLFWWEVPVKKLLWGIWIGGTLFFLGRWCVYPLLQYGFRLRGYLSDEEAARWIGRRLPEVRDKLLNALQLARQDPAQNAAIALALEERTRQLSVLPWEVTLPRGEVRRYALFLLIALIGGGLLWLGFPAIFREGSFRFLRPTQAFAKPLPFSLWIEGLKPFYRQSEPLSLSITLAGEKLPQTLYASSEDGPLPLHRENPTHYTLSLPAIQKDFILRIEVEGKVLRTFPIRVVRPPALQGFTVYAMPPAYTRKPADTLSQPIVRILRGTTLRIRFSVASERPYTLLTQGLPFTRTSAHEWEATFTASTSGTYKLSLQDLLFSDSLLLQIETFPDYHPSVQLFSEWFNPQSLEQTLRVRLMDDFGFTKAILWYRIAESATPGRSQESFRAYPFAIASDPLQEKTLSVPWKALGIAPSDKVEYYVEVWDNDALTGPKSSRSILYTIEPLSDTYKQEVFTQLQDSLWQELSKLHKELESLLSQGDRTQQSRQATALSERFRALRSELRALQRLAAEQELYTPEILERMQQLQKLLESIDPQKPEQLLSQLQQPPKDSLTLQQLKEELDRAWQEWEEKMARLEALLPEYQQERRLEELLTKLLEMAEQQNQLSTLPDSLQRAPSSQALQENLKNQTQALQRQIDSLQQKASSGALKDSLGKASQYLKEASQSMQKALEEMQQGGSPQKEQKEAADALEQALSAADQGLQQENAEEEAEEYEALRRLLKSILNLSFRQEAARKKAQEGLSFLPFSQPLLAEQQAIRQDYQQVHDSLNALAHRSPAIEEPILDLLREINRYFQALTPQQPELFVRRQQYILQGLNRLANLMTELLAQLEANQRDRQQAGGACQRPFKVRRKGATGRPSSSQNKAAGQSPSPRPAQKNGPTPSLPQLQQQLNETLQKALSPNPASENPGGLSPDERARLSAQQELIRLRLQELMRQNPSDAGQLQSLIEEMQKAEREILSGAVTRERLLRQQQILTRLLDYERSQHERELDPERESRTAQQFFQRTTGVYPRPQLSPAPARGPLHLWFYHPAYQRLIESYQQQP